jgi:ferric-dicitrate binding protein FerR (iron transport regulator)
MNKNYTTYNTIDFAEDSFFIKWVKTNDLQAKHFWANFLKNHPEKNADIMSAKQLVLAIQVKEEEPSDESIENLWTKIDKQISDESIEKPSTKRVPILRWMGYAAAAACIGFFVMFFFKDAAVPKATPGFVSTGKAEQLIHYLPDGSEIQLNSVSSITFDETNWETSRNIELQGEAFFKVQEGSTFTVKTNKGTVQVLGTSFNINTYADHFLVTFFTVKLKVTTPKNNQFLTKGLMTELENGTLIEPISFNDSLAIGWKEGQFSFKNASLGEVLAAIERQFDVEISAKKEDKRRTGDFYFENNELEDALYKVLYPLGLKGEVTGNKVLIK